MRLRFLLSAVCLCTLGSSLALRAQQAESVVSGQPQPPEVKEFQGYEDQWSNAVIKNDQYTLEFLLSPVFVNISSTGDVTTRNQQIAMLFDKGDEPISLEQRVISVRTFGDTAVVSGTYIAKWRNEGSVREERGIFTHIYNHDRSHWACVNAQRTAVVDLKPGKQRASRKSDASEPFHIPLLFKGAQPKQDASQTAANANPPQ
jgi:ketosteroid isomerase-like protein